LQCSRLPRPSWPWGHHSWPRGELHRYFLPRQSHLRGLWSPSWPARRRWGPGCWRPPGLP
jgi:hypothetical protein